jgi:4-hydroxybenzoate polyprenyltransferase
MHGNVYSDSRVVRGIVFRGKQMDEGEYALVSFVIFLWGFSMLFTDPTRPLIALLSCVMAEGFKTIRRDPTVTPAELTDIHVMTKSLEVNAAIALGMLLSVFSATSTLYGFEPLDVLWACVVFVACSYFETIRFVSRV